MAKNRGRRRRDDVRLMARIAAIVLAVEIPAAMVAAALPVQYWPMSLINGALLVFVCAPIIFFSVVRPYVLERDRAEMSAKQSADELRARNEQFDAALQHMQHGLAMFDAQQRLIVCNQVYAHMFGLSLDEVKPGTTLGQILDARIKRGLFAFGSPEEYRRVLLGEEKGRDSTIHQLSDGRWIAAGREPLAGGGWVATNQDVTDRQRSREQITFMAHHDALTGLPNRALLDETFGYALTSANPGEVVVVHLLDLDHFKNVNDTLGHQAGDKLLQAAASRLRGVVRDADTIARMGGDEFIILQKARAQSNDAEALAKRIIDVLGRPFDIDGHIVSVGASVGIAVSPDDGAAVDQLIRNADLALYQAKGNGRGRHTFFKPEMEDRLIAELTMESDLRKALAAGEFELYFQPIVDLDRDEIVGCEALLRWHHPEKGLVAPGVFIAFAEKCDLINRIGEWALRQACLTAKNWPEHVRVCVNLSPAQFQNTRVLEVIVGALAASGLPPQRLEVEITETVVLRSTAETIATLRNLRDLGVRVALDDFGTGYASLSYLQRFRFDRIKIDHCFTKNIITDPSSLEIVRAVGLLAGGLNIDMTVEGIESREQLDAVRSIGCTEAQGFLFGQPMPAHEIEQVLFSEVERQRTNADAAA